MNTVQPDAPVISFDASTISMMPPEIQELFQSFYEEQLVREEEAKRQVDVEYQDKLAALLSEQPGWTEVVLHTSLKTCLYQHFLHEDPEQGIPVSIYKAVMGLGERPTIFQFYNDLYGIKPLKDGLLSFDSYDESRLDEWIDSKPILVNHRDREHPFQLYENFYDYIKAVQQETSYIYMGSFWRPRNGFLTSKRNAMSSIGGFCIDIDRSWVDVEHTIPLRFPEGVISTLMDVFEEKPEIRPNYIMLSGYGVQLWYVFGTQIPLLSKRSPRRDKYQAVLKGLNEWFMENLPPNMVTVDISCATINHAFRAPGSPTKFKTETRLFCYQGINREMVDPIKLSDFVGGDIKPYDLADWNQEEYERIKQENKIFKDKRKGPATQKQVNWLSRLASMGCVEDVPQNMTIADADALIKQAEIVYTKHGQWKRNKGHVKTSAGHDVQLKPRHEKLYENVLKRIEAETFAGTRYNAMFALSGVAYTCGIPKKRLEDDLMQLLDSKFGESLGNDGKPLSKDDVKAAILGYNPLGALRPREQQEYRYGWKFNPPAKRNGRRQLAHLKIARASLMTANEEDGFVHQGRPKGSGTKKQQILDYAAAHPEENHSQIARTLGVSRPTVVKWMKQMEETKITVMTECELDCNDCRWYDPEKPEEDGFGGCVKPDDYGECIMENQDECPVIQIDGEKVNSV